MPLENPCAGFNWGGHLTNRWRASASLIALWKCHRREAWDLKVESVSMIVYSLSLLIWSLNFLWSLSFLLFCRHFQNNVPFLLRERIRQRDFLLWRHTREWGIFMKWMNKLFFSIEIWLWLLLNSLTLLALFLGI